jgi:hypothetical protein
LIELKDRRSAAATSSTVFPDTNIDTRLSCSAASHLRFRLSFSFGLLIPRLYSIQDSRAALASLNKSSKAHRTLAVSSPGALHAFSITDTIGQA